MNRAGVGFKGGNVGCGRLTAAGAETGSDTTVIRPRNSAASASADPAGGFRVVLLADSASSEDVNIVDFRLTAEQPPATSANDLPATAAGLPPAAPAPLATPPAAGTPAEPG